MSSAFVESVVTGRESTERNPVSDFGSEKTGNWPLLCRLGPRRIQESIRLGSKRRSDAPNPSVPTRRDDVERLRGSVRVEHTLARLGAERLWHAARTSASGSRALGALTGGQAVQMVRAGPGGDLPLRLAGRRRREPRRRTYPDQSLYPANSVPALVRRINNALLRADQIALRRGRRRTTYWLAPIVADAEAGFGGPLNAFELMKAMIEAGAAGVHFEDQLASREEVRPHGRQGAGADEPVHPDAGRRAARRRRRSTCRPLLVARTDALARDAADERRRRARPRVPAPASAPPEGFFRVRDGHRGGDRPRPRLRAVRRPALVRDVDARPRRGRAVRRGDPRAVPRQAAGVQLLAVVQLERAPRRRADRAASSGSSPRWATRSSSSPSPASTPSTSRCSSSRAATASDAMTRVRRAAGARVRRRGASGYTATAPPARGRRRLLRPGRAGRLSGGSATLALAGSTEEQQFH